MRRGTDSLAEAPLEYGTASLLMRPLGARVEGGMLARGTGVGTVPLASDMELREATGSSPAGSVLLPDCTGERGGL